MSASQTDFIKFLVSDCIQGIEEDLVRHFLETKNPRLGYCNGGHPVYLKDVNFKEQKEWIINKASGKNNKDRLKFIKLCNIIKDRKIRDLEFSMTHTKTYYIDMYKGTGNIQRLSHFIKFADKDDRIYLVCIDKEVDESWVSIPKSLQNEIVISNWEKVENDDPTLLPIVDSYPHRCDIFSDSDSD